MPPLEISSFCHRPVGAAFGQPGIVQRPHRGQVNTVRYQFVAIRVLGTATGILICLSHVATRRPPQLQPETVGVRIGRLFPQSIPRVQSYDQITVIAGATITANGGEGGSSAGAVI